VGTAAGTATGFVLLDAQGRVAFADRGAEGLLGRSGAALRGRPFEEVLAPAYAPLFARTLAQARAEGGLHRLALTLPSLGLAASLSVTDGEAALFLGAAAGEAPGAGGPRVPLRSLLDSAHALVLVVGPDERLVEWSLRAQEALGLQRAAGPGPYLLELVCTAEGREEVRARLAEVRAGGQVEGQEMEVCSLADGAHRTLQWSGSRVADAQGRHLVLVVGQDVTARTRAERALRESEARLALSLEATQDALWDWDVAADRLRVQGRLPDGQHVPAGREVDGALRRILQFLAWMPSEQAEALRDAATAHLVGDTPRLEAEHPVSLPGREGQRWYRLQGMVVSRSAGGAPLRMLGTLLDVTERKQLEEQLRQAQKMEAVGQLAGGVAHDFNNLLTAVITHLQLALDELPPRGADRGGGGGAGARGEVEEALEASRRAAALTRQLLTLSRRQAPHARVLDANARVAEAERLLRRLLGGGVRLEVALQRAPALVRADPGQLDQVLMNLVLNARDAMPRGGALTVATGEEFLGEAAARAWGLPRAGRYVRLAVSDTGEGMDAATRARVFEPFFTTKPLGQGTGLGLAVVYGIVSAAGGTVHVESAPGRGSTFTVLLPRAEAPLEGPSGHTPLPLPPRGHETVLLVEDELPVRTSTRRLLQRHGYRVLEAAHGADALRLLRERPGEVAVVLTDLRMPEMGGRELVAHLRAAAPALPVVYVSGYTDAEVPEGEPLDGVPLLLKPYEAEDLLRLLRACLDAAAPAGPPPHLTRQRG
jgi:PAS domain S-box-containing protein